MNSLVSKFIGVWLHPWQAMASVKEEGEGASLKPSFVFIVVMGLVSGLITAIAGTLLPTGAIPPGGSKAMVWLAVVIVPLISFIGSFVGAFIIWGLIDGLLKGTKDEYKTAYRMLALLAAFSPISALLSPIPGHVFADFTVGQLLAFGVNIWATVVMIGGIIIIRETPKVRTIVTCGIFFLLLFLLSIVARVATQREFARGGAGLDEFGTTGEFNNAPSDDLGATSDKLEDELQDLADKAKGGNQPATTNAAPKK